MPRISLYARSTLPSRSTRTGEEEGYERRFASCVCRRLAKEEAIALTYSVYRLLEVALMTVGVRNMTSVCLRVNRW